MDSHRFDEISRGLATGLSRRRVIAGLSIGALGGLLGGRGEREAEAACAPGQVTRRGGCVCRATGRPPVEAAACPAGQVACRGCCVAACRGDLVLNPDRCACECPPGLAACGRQCVDAALYQSDLSNCGGCGIVCQAPPAAAASCAGGQCGFACEAGFKPCNGACIPATSCCTAADCPAPTDPCQAEATCTAGACGFAAAESGTPCRAATDPCEGIATCAGDSSVCPPNPPLPDGTSCGPSGETCRGGVCTSSTCLSLGAICTSSAECCQDEPTVCVSNGTQDGDRCVHVGGGTCGGGSDESHEEACGAFFSCEIGARCACDAISTSLIPTPCGGLCCLGAQCLDYDNAICSRVPETGECPGSIFTPCGNACCPPGSTCLDTSTSSCSTGCAQYCLP